MDGGAWKAAVHGVAEGRTRLSDFTFTFMHWRRKWQPTPVFLPGESQGQGAWWAAIYGVAQSWTRLKRLSSSSSEIPGLGRSPGKGKGYPLQYSGLENSMDCIVHGVAESQTRLREFHCHFHHLQN